MHLALVLTCTLLLVGCTSSFTALRGVQDSSINDLRMEIADLKHALHGTEVELKLLEERLETMEVASPSVDDSAELKKKIALLEKNLYTLSSQTSITLSVIDGKLDEISKLRSTLSKLSHTPEVSSYQVKSGDSLEKIARKFQISVDALKQENNLSTDKIVVGQELAIPSS